MKVLGIDPGLRITGFGIIDGDKKHHTYITSGIITTNSKQELHTRLKIIITNLVDIIKQYNPQIASVEKIFVNKYPKSTLLLGYTRGAILATCIMNNLIIAEYNPLIIKKTITGYGHANKEQIINMVNQILSLKGNIRKDSADAIALALTYIYHH